MNSAGSSDVFSPAHRHAARTRRRYNERMVERRGVREHADSGEDAGMSTMVAELYDALRKAGVEEQLARDAARAVLAADARSELATRADIAELKAATKADIAELKAATKADIAELKAATKADIAELKAATKTDMAALRAEFAELKASTRADLAELKADLIKWNLGAMAVLTTIFAAIVRLG